MLANEYALRKADLAREILENELFTDIIEELKDSYFSTIEHTLAHESDTREYAYFRLKALQDIVSELKAAVSNAEFEQE